jgi:tripartite motif-containing protein 71
MGRGEFVGSRGVLRSIRPLVGFLLLLMACAAAPSLADDPPVEPQEVLFPASEEVDLEKLPGPADVTAAIERAEEEEAEREEWLAGPEAEQQRQASRTAFTGLTAAEAEALLGDTFAEQLQSLNSDPARYLSDAQLVSVSEDPTAGTVKEDGASAVLDAEIPLQTENEEGDLEKVDLSLEATAAGFETLNALVDVEIPSSPSDPIEIGAEGVTVSQQGAAPEQSARRFGDENVFYPDVLPDTDMLVSPIAGGIEIFNQLRSQGSPETFRFDVDVPEGGTLRPTGAWGVEVVSGEATIATIPPATAVDAQGTEVPVDMAVEGDSIVLHVAHRDGDYAMPILLDPILENNQDWIYGQNHNALDMGVWGFNKNVAGMYGSTGCIYHCFGQPGNVRGLFVSAQSGTYFAGQIAQWSYSAPNASSFITSATLSPYVRYDHPNCNAATTQYKQPHDYFGIWGNGAWNYHSVNSANYPGHSYTLPVTGQAAVFGLGTGGSNFSIPCWRDLYAAGAHVWLDDSNWPYFNWSPAANGVPQGWVSNETHFTITSQVSDAGLGIKNVRLHHAGGPIISDITPEYNECAGTRRSPCYTTHSASFDGLHGGYFAPGERDAWLSATDATGKTVTSSYHWPMRVDNQAPILTFDGQFAEETKADKGPQAEDEAVENLPLPVYNLTITAKDYEIGAEAQNLGSGVKDIEVYLDDVKQPVPWVPQTCTIAGNRCPGIVSKTYPVALSTLTTSGKHTLKVVAIDQVEKHFEREIEFEYFPATGMKDDYVMHYFPLPDGQGNEAEEEHPDRPELAVNVMNGNLVYRETDIDVEGPAALDLEVERYYNSMLPDNEQTEWGEDWTLAQTPELDPIKKGGSSVPNEAEVLDSSGVIEEGVDLPTATGASSFDPALQATLTKKASGGYELTDETGESAGSISFDAGGQTEALVDEGFAKVDYEYEGGKLAEIEVSDPATFSADPSELVIPEPELVTEPAHAGSFGSNGSGDGQLKSPGGVAVDSQGNLWVVDKANNRIQKFDPTGKFISKFGSAGTDNGRFNRPTAIEIAPNGDLLVTDAGNSRVQRFNSAGAFISKFGSKGTGNGQFAGAGPESLALDPAGNIWVSDTYGGRVQKFSSTGTFLQSVGSKGSAPGQLGEPTGIDIDPTGKVWVADWPNHRVSVFGAGGDFLSSFGSYGTGNGQFRSPDAIETDNLGNVWVGDAANHNVQQFDLAGEFKAKFGAAGSGPGQFAFSYPMDITVDSQGNLWVTDVNNHRVQHWRVPVERPAYVRTFGSSGSEQGQLAAPAGIAVGVDGSLWVVDKSNHRIQRFDKSGKYLSQVGAFGTGDGQFFGPTAIAVDRDGNFLITDSNNNRVQKFSPEGQFISKFGSGGAGNGQFSSPEGIATDPDGNIWVADSGNGRIQHFNEEGKFVGVVSSKGTEPGQLYKPVGVDIDSEGRIWVTDFQTHLVSAFESDGAFVGQIGGLGSGPGQFNRPSAIEIDARDNIWITDQVNNRVQRFDLEGVYVGQFGSQGNGVGQFSFPMIWLASAGITSDEEGRIWVSDVSNNRVQQWMLGHYFAEETQLDLSDGDPKVEVETAGDLVTSVAGNAAGTHSYEHEGDFLVSHEGPDGTTTYEKNPAGLMSKVTLPNGTWASISYFPDNRVQSVTVAHEGVDPKTTDFYYKTGPPQRQSIVTPPDKPQVTYDIAQDGSVLKWWHKEQGPKFLTIDGNLYWDKGKEVSGDLVLEVHADSPHGLASIEIIANGNQLVSEKRCEQDPGTPEIECVQMEDMWVTDTGSLTPGILNMEVIITDRFDHSASERWWVQIPHTPPPTPGYPKAPTFNEILKFREDYGLEVVFPVPNERALVERIFDLRNAWYSPDTPLGQVARSSWERWGVPMRPADVAEMEYRERYVAQNGPLIDEWGYTHHPTTYAGHYVDHRAGGILHIGFTGSQPLRFDELLQQVTPEAPERLATYTSNPMRPRLDLEVLEGQIAAAVEQDMALGGVVAEIGIDDRSNAVIVGAVDPSVAGQRLVQLLGTLAGIDVRFDPDGPRLLSGRNRTEGRMLAGDRVLTEWANGAKTGCTAGFGAFEIGRRLPNGTKPRSEFVLSAGHCAGVDQVMYRADGNRTPVLEPKANWRKVGRATRNPYWTPPRFIDAMAIWTEGRDVAPRKIFGEGGHPGVRRPVVAKRGQRLCVSGAASNRVKCGEVVGIKRVYVTESKRRMGVLKVDDLETIVGDSGAPVWDARTRAAVGILVAGYERAKDRFVLPLLNTPTGRSTTIEGALHPEEMGDLHVATEG